MYKPNASISFFYICESEEEMNRIWNAFLEKGSVLMPLDSYEWSEKYGWINDVYGISWQLSLGGIESVGQRLSPCLLFTGERYGQAEAAMQYYATVFKDHKLDGILRYGGQETPDQEGKIKHAQIAFLGHKFMFMESAQYHAFTFNEGVSLTIHCDTQEEIDYYWGKLTAGGQESMCGGCKTNCIKRLFVSNSKHKPSYCFFS